MERRDLLAVEGGLAYAVMPMVGAAVPGAPTMIHVEALDAAAWKSLGGRSAILFLDADCATKRATVRSADVYQGSNLLGDGRLSVDLAALPVTERALSGVAIGLCARPVPAPPSPLTSFLASAPPPPALGSPVPIPPAPVLAPPPDAGRSTTVQVGAFASSAAALVALRDLAVVSPGLMQGRLQRLEPVTVEGALLYRAVVTGFADVDDAIGFCRAVADGGRPCLVRRGS